MAFKADLLRKKLDEEGKTQKFLADATEKTVRTVSRWLNGANPPKGKDLDVIARVLNCRPHDFDPSHADDGTGIAIHARISIASHNAYEIMGKRYGITQRQIIELAPVLFSIAAAHALKVPHDDLSLHKEALRQGLSSPIPGPGFSLDQQASANRKCFGLQARDPSEVSRNLFCEAVSRLSLDISDHVSADQWGTSEAGEVPSAIGFIPDVELLARMTCGDGTLIEALTTGRVRLSKCIDDFQKGDAKGAEAFTAIVRRELATVDNADQARLTALREESLLKLQAWRTFYQERHPDLAREYDQIVEAYCHDEVSASEAYGDDLNQYYWAQPYLEHREIDEGLLPGLRDKSPLDRLVLKHKDPIVRRFAELEAHRSELKSQFEEASK